MVLELDGIVRHLAAVYDSCCNFVSREEEVASEKKYGTNERPPAVCTKHKQLTGLWRGLCFCVTRLKLNVVAERHTCSIAEGHDRNGNTDFIGNGGADNRVHDRVL